MARSNAATVTRRSFSRLKNPLDVPHLIDIQRRSFAELVDPKNGLLRATIDDISPTEDYTGNLAIVFDEFSFDDPPPGCSVVPFAPFHPTLDEPAHFRLFVEGEIVRGCEYRGFMVHRGIEKLGDSVLTYNEIPLMAARSCSSRTSASSRGWRSSSASGWDSFER